VNNPRFMVVTPISDDLVAVLICAGEPPAGTEDGWNERDVEVQQVARIELSPVAFEAWCVRQLLWLRQRMEKT